MSWKKALGVGAATTLVLVWLIYIARTDSLGAALARAGMMGGFYLAIIFASWALDTGDGGDKGGRWAPATVTPAAPHPPRDGDLL